MNYASRIRNFATIKARSHIRHFYRPFDTDESLFNQRTFESMFEDVNTTHLKCYKIRSTTVYIWGENPSPDALFIVHVTAASMNLLACRKKNDSFSTDGGRTQPNKNAGKNNGSSLCIVMREYDDNIVKDVLHACMDALIGNHPTFLDDSILVPIDLPVLVVDFHVIVRV
jgi:hypothetical protein